VIASWQATSDLFAKLEAADSGSSPAQLLSQTSDETMGPDQEMESDRRRPVLSLTPSEEREVELPEDMEELTMTRRGAKRYTVPPTPPPKTPRTMEHLRRQGSLRSEYSTSSSSNASVEEKNADEQAEEDVGTEASLRESQVLPQGSSPAYREPVLSAPVVAAYTAVYRSPTPLRAFPPAPKPPMPPVVGLPAAPKLPTAPQPPSGTLPHPLRSQSVWGPAAIPAMGTPPQRPASPPRPMTASTRRLTFSTLASSTGSAAKKTVKYSSRGVELVPQPSDDAEDPLVGSHIPLTRVVAGSTRCSR